MTKQWAEGDIVRDGKRHGVVMRGAVYWADDAPFTSPIPPGLVASTLSAYDAELSRVLEARERMASAAPDMARVLLAVEWTNSDDEDMCPSCGGLNPAEEAKRRWPRHPDAGTVGHAPDCALDAALRKAGVR